MWLAAILAYLAIGLFLGGAYWREVGNVGAWRWVAVPFGLFWPLFVMLGVVMIAWVWVVMDDS